MLRATSLVVVFVAAARAAELPSCSADEENCVQEGMDLSPEGIAACLKALPSRSEACSAYLKLMDGCTADLEREGVCGDAAANGEAVPCLVQRTKPEDLSAACQAALPPVEEVTGLAKYWVDGKRELEDDEASELNEDDADTYKRWLKKRKGPKSDKQKERDYAVRKQKKEAAEKAIIAAATEAAAAALAAGDDKVLPAATAAANKAMDTAIAEDMTGTLKPFTKTQLSTIAKDAVKAAKKKVKSEL